MNFIETREFLSSLGERSEQEILDNMPYIKEYFCETGYWASIVKHFENICKFANKDRVLYELLKGEERFSVWEEKLDFPEKLKFGVEIEVVELPIGLLQSVFESDDVSHILKTLNVPIEIINRIVQNSCFADCHKKSTEYNKWIFSPESRTESSEASSPIMENNLSDLNQIAAICLLFKVLGGNLNGGTGLHINLGVDYFECNQRAIENLLKIWGECEELFFKMANPEGEEIRVAASSMASPIKQNIQDFFENDGSITLNNEEDMEKFIYQIQARNRMFDIVQWERRKDRYDLLRDLQDAKSDEERFQVYRMYNRILKEKDEVGHSKVRYTSINFNHMTWNLNDSGRIEIRIFNSSLEPMVIFEDLELVGKIFEVSLRNAKDSNYKKDKFEILFARDVTETRKVNNLLNLLFDNPAQKKKFKERWQSIRKKEAYKKFRSGKDTFER